MATCARPQHLDKLIERYDVLIACIEGASAALGQYAASGDLNDRIVSGLNNARHEFGVAMEAHIKKGDRT